MSVQCPPSGVKQTSRRKAAISVFDPKLADFPVGACAHVRRPAECRLRLGPQFRSQVHTTMLV